MTALSTTEVGFLANQRDFRELQSPSAVSSLRTARRNFFLIYGAAATTAAAITFASYSAPVSLTRNPPTQRALAALDATKLAVVHSGALPANADGDRNADLSAEILSYANLDPDWDGANGLVPTHDSVEQALTFIDLLPLGSRPTGTLVEGSGEVGFYWNEKNCYIDITFDGVAISYYGEVRRNDGVLIDCRGTEKFNGKAIPIELLKVISSV